MGGGGGGGGGGGKAPARKTVVKEKVVEKVVHVRDDGQMEEEKARIKEVGYQQKSQWPGIWRGVQHTCITGLCDSLVVVK